MTSRPAARALEFITWTVLLTSGCGASGATPGEDPNTSGGPGATTGATGSTGFGSGTSGFGGAASTGDVQATATTGQVATTTSSGLTTSGATVTGAGTVAAGGASTAGTSSTSGTADASGTGNATTAAATTAAATTGSAGSGGGTGGDLVWPNEMSSANSDDWLSENHDRILQLRPKVLVINLESSTSADRAQTLVDQHIAAVKEASSFHKYKDQSAEPAVVYQLEKIVNADKGSRIDYDAWNTQEFADSVLQIEDPADGHNLTLCELFEKGVINEVWCMASSDPKCGETQEAKQVYDASGAKSPGRFAHASNGDNITGLGCGVTVRITDFNSGRGAGCHLHAMGHAWERYMDANAVPMLRKQAARFLNWDLDTRVGAPFSNFYSACNSNGSLLTDCMLWESETRVRSGPSAATSFDLADMSGGCGNAHFYPNSTGTYSYDANSPDPTVLTSCENYGMHNGSDGADLTTSYNNSMTDTFYGRSQQTCPADQPACDDDCGGHGTTYLYQNFPGPGTAATNDDGTPMQNWWVYLFY